MWNYRVVMFIRDEVECYGIHEVYYNKKGEIWGISEESIAPFGETLDELKSDFRLMSNAFNHPPIIESEVVYAKGDWEDD